jgi:histidine triad (HIT) family protein
MGACLFCDIVSGVIPAERLYEDGQCVAISDIAPQAPVHLLVLPREHFASAKEVDTAREPLTGHLVHVAAQLARSRGLEAQGYRLVFNHGSHAGQTVHHLHLHLLGGRVLNAMG